MEQGHGFFRHRRLQPFGIPRLRRLINIAVDDCERRRIKGASIPAAGMENATITLGSNDFYKRVYVRSTRRRHGKPRRSEEHTSELQSLMRISYAVFCLKKKKNQTSKITTHDDNTTYTREASMRST